MGLLGNRITILCGYCALLGHDITGLLDYRDIEL